MKIAGDADKKTVKYVNEAALRQYERATEKAIGRTELVSLALLSIFQRRQEKFKRSRKLR